MLGAELTEAERIAVLHALDILDTPSDPALDALVNLAAQTFKTSGAAITLVDQHRQWFKERVGIGMPETPRDVAFCDHTIRRDEMTIIADATRDPRFHDNPLVTESPAIRFYAGAPLIVGGARIGAFCVIDTVPRTDFDMAAQAVLTAMATAITATLELRREVQLRRSLDRSLREQTRKLVLAESMAGVGHWTLDLNTKAVTWSDEVYRIHGLDRDSFDPRMGDTIRFYAPEDQAAVIAALDDARLQGKSFNFKLALIRATDGARRIVTSIGDVTLDAAGKPDQVFGVFRDVTEEENLLLRVREDRERFRLLTVNATDMIATMAPDSTVRFVTPAIQRILGYTPEEIIGTRTLALTHPDDIGPTLQVFRDMIDAGPDGPTPTYQFRGRHKDGSWVWLEGQPRIEFDAQGKPVAYQDVVRDITARKQLEDALHAARLAAESAAQAKSDFLANMSHELRTPLNSVIGFADVLAGRTGLGVEESRYVGLIGGAARRLLGIVNDVLDLSKIEAGAITLHAAPVDLRLLTGDMMDMVRLQAGAKGLQVHVDVPARPVPVLADADRLRQILFNLLGNAIKFTQSGAIRLALRTTPSATHVAVELAVSDTGIGIPAGRIDHLFQRFEQADSSISRRFGGTGLGLSICRALVAHMGGSIDVASRSGEGSCFTVRLDLPAASLPAAPAAAAAAPVAGALAGLRVLVAEDVALNQELIGLFLETSGARIDFVDDGRAAVDAAQDTAYDVIVMDMQMPVMDGLEACRRIRAGGGASARAPIVALTANVLDAEVARATAAGMDGHLGKPFDAAGLVGVLKLWAGGRVSRFETAGTTQD